MPVNKDTVGEWKHPPYSGYYDGMLIIKREEKILETYLRRENMGTWQPRRQGRADWSAVGSMR